jgi:hypothetical protein
MTFYKKYLKYKIKYLNLFNQLGSGYTQEEFNILIQNTDDDGFLIDESNDDGLLLDPISLDKIHKDNAIFIDSNIYDANELLNYIINKYLSNDYNITIPHNRKPITRNMYDYIYNKTTKLDDQIIENERKIIINNLKKIIRSN